MRRLKTWVFLTVLWVFAATGCAERDLSDPPKILYGRDTCAWCRMIIQEERFACAAVSADGRYLKFDDIGCLVRHESEGSVPDMNSWVRDPSAGWVVKDEAYFVRQRDLVTPMGYGFAAFASADSAEKFIKGKGGRVVTWTELKTEEIK